MQISGINIIDFLDELDRYHIGYDIGRDRPGTIMVTVTLIGKRLEVEFFKDHIEYSVFEGDESVYDSYQDLLRMIKNEEMRK